MPAGAGRSGARIGPVRACLKGSLNAPSGHPLHRAQFPAQAREGGRAKEARPVATAQIAGEKFGRGMSILPACGYAVSASGLDRGMGTVSACVAPVARNSAATPANHSGVRWSIGVSFILWKELVPFIITHPATGFAVEPTLVFNVTCKLERA